jgi:hypothetical protein
MQEMIYSEIYMDFTRPELRSIPKEDDNGSSGCENFKRNKT